MNPAIPITSLVCSILLSYLPLAIVIFIARNFKATVSLYDLRGYLYLCLVRFYHRSKIHRDKEATIETIFSQHCISVNSSYRKYL